MFLDPPLIVNDDEERFTGHVANRDSGGCGPDDSDDSEFEDNGSQNYGDNDMADTYSDLEVPNDDYDLSDEAPSTSHDDYSEQSDRFSNDDDTDTVMRLGDESGFNSGRTSHGMVLPIT